MSLKNKKFEYEYHEDRLVNFLQPCIKISKIYWRAVGFFSSTAFEAIGKDLGDFIENGGNIKLITSVELNSRDVEAINDGIKEKDICEKKLVEQIKKESEKLRGNGALILTKLLELNRLEIKIAITSYDLTKIYHKKMGIFFDSEDNYVAFTGSMNDSESGYGSNDPNQPTGNEDFIDVFTSWGSRDRAELKKIYFEQLWTGEKGGIKTYPFPEAAKRELIRIKNSTQIPPNIENEPEPDKKTNEEELWDHQKKAIEAFLKAKKGVLEMATGTGKTRTALEIFKILFQQKKVSSLIISTHGIANTDLLNQWYKEVSSLTLQDNFPVRILRHYDRDHQGSDYIMNPHHSVLLISNLAIHKFIDNLSNEQKENILFIHDEIHGFGSPDNILKLNGRFQGISYILGLSATAEREYDDTGNQFIERNVGRVIYKFDLKKAIKKGILCEFDYFHLDYDPSDEDKNAVQKLFAQKEALKKQGTPMSDKEFAIKVAGVHKVSIEKLEPFKNFIARNPTKLKRSIIFAHTVDFGKKALPLIHEYRNDYHTYFSDDETSILNSFARGEIECLITCHKLSEGIDIKSVSSIFLLSSDKSKLETIQRIGRCLRVDPDNRNKKATVVDFIRQQDPEKQLNPDQERRIWLAEVASTKCEKREDGTNS